MKKNFFTILLAVLMVINVLPSTVFAVQDATAPPANTSENESVYLGTEQEYATTIATMFDENGLRKIDVGYNSNNGVLNNKKGLINKYGNFVVQPIYDEIELYAHGPMFSDVKSILPLNFIGGYTQAVRDGKMGLLNTRGEEVVPCKYDFVGLPSEGVCRVLIKKDDKNFYLGYWSLEQNKEIVAPNKYITSQKNDRIGGLYAASDPYLRCKQKPAGDYLSVHDFNGGYAMVYTGKSVNGHPYATVIDKNGKDIYGKSYLINNRLTFNDDYSKYPQQGQYLSFIEELSVKGYTFTKLYNEWHGNQHDLSYTDTFATGLAGASGIMIPATYTSGVLASIGEASFFINPATFQIIPDKGMVLTNKDTEVGFLYGGAMGAIDLKGNVIIPFDREINKELYYDDVHSVITSSNGPIYNMAGKNITNFEHGGTWFYNGYGKITSPVYNKAIEDYEYSEYYVKKDGKILNITEKLGLDKSKSAEYSEVSVGGFGWVKNNSGKWGLIDMSGNTVLPFQYDEVNHNAWSEGENGFARVTQDGKVGMVNAQGKLVLPCEYSYITNKIVNSPIVIVKDANNKEGIIDIKTGKVIIPIAYDKIGAFGAYKQPQNTLFEMGVYYVREGEKSILLDKNCKELFSVIGDFNEALNGLYSGNNGNFDNRGRTIIPDNLFRTKNLEIGSSYTIYIENGKVYRLSANYIESTYGFKPLAPATASAVPSSTKLVVNGKNMEVDAYSIGGTNYIKLRDLAAMINGTDKNFEVMWDNAKNAINLVSGKAYTPTGVEMTKGDGKAKTAKRTISKTFVNGAEVEMTAYNIGESNYFKLRDVMQIFDVNVGYDAVSATATLTTAQSYTLAPYEQGKMDAHTKAYTAASGNQYVQKPTYKEAFAQFQSVPDKNIYKVGDPFEISGFKAAWIDIYGRATDISDDIELKVNSTKIYDGYEFQEAGEKTVDCYYNGEKLNNFKISVISEDDDLLQDGDYYMQIYGKYVMPVAASSTFYLELFDKKPEKAFTVKLIKIDADRGPMYSISYDGTYIMQPSSKEGAQLQTSKVPHMWRINQYSTFCTIRDYGNQKLLVNASGSQSKNGTKVIIWGHTGKAPENAKIQFIPVK